MSQPHPASTAASVAYRAVNTTPTEQSRILLGLALDADIHYAEEEPTVAEWLRSLVPGKKGLLGYIRTTFQVLQWLPRYSVGWLVGDSIAGLTVGFVVIPQAMAYALLATLSPEYGLYTSFVGAALYWLFGTSKDIVIGTTAVGSLLIGSVITSIQDQRPDTYSREEIAKATSAVAGIILLFIGFLRLGWIIEFIPYIPISAFVTAASITIMATQFPVLMGIRGVNTRQAPYLTIIDSLKGLPGAQVDAAIGLTSIMLLYIIRYLCAEMEVRHPSRKRAWAIASSMRLTFTMLLYTFISWLVNRSTPSGQSPFKIVGPIERGFKHAGPPRLDGDLVLLILPELPAILIILVIEHIAIAKSFGRIFGYTVIPSQEILAQGASNLFGTFVGGYVCTGSFGASAVLSKAGVRTPLAGLFSALILVLALYALTAVFYYIPMAALAGLIIHAVANLVTPPRSLYKYWQLSPLELIIWVAGVIIAIFVGLEVSIYVTISLSLVLLLVRLTRTKGRFLGMVHVYHVVSDGPSPPRKSEDVASAPMDTCAAASHAPLQTAVSKDGIGSRDIYLPLDRLDASNPLVAVEPPYPGVFIYRFPEGLNYVNQAHHMARLLAYIKTHSRPASPPHGGGSSGPTCVGDRLWSDQAPTVKELAQRQHLPRLRAVVLDCSAVNNVDITAVQGLVDARNTLDRHACGCGHSGDGESEGGQCVEWHFAGLSNRWARRALAVAGFGVPAGPAARPQERAQDGEDNRLAGWRPVYVVATSLAGDKAEDVKQARARKGRKETKEGRTVNKEEGMTVVHSVNRPFFHIDLTEAVDAAVRDAMRMEERDRLGGGDGDAGCTGPARA